MDDSHNRSMLAEQEVLQQPTPPPQDSQSSGSTDTHIPGNQIAKRMDLDEDTAAPDMLSPMSAADGEKQDERDLSAFTSPELDSPSTGYDFSNVRVCASLSISLVARNTKGISSSFPLHHRPSCVRVVDSMEPNNQSVKSMMFKSKSST